MLRLLRLLFVLAARSFRSRRDLLLENLALRQQLTVLKERRPQPKFSTADSVLHCDQASKQRVDCATDARDVSV